MAVRENPPPDYVPTFPSNPFKVYRKRREGITYHLAGNYELHLFNPWAFNKRINSTVGGGDDGTQASVDIGEWVLVNNHLVSLEEAPSSCILQGLRRVYD